MVGELCEAVEGFYAPVQGPPMGMQGILGQ